MNLYLLTQQVNVGYDTYDSAVVAAESEEEARKIHPSDHSDIVWWEDEWERVAGSWANRLENVQCTLLGTADVAEKGVVCASFNAS
jgi:hypothetical protein